MVAFGRQRAVAAGWRDRGDGGLFAVGFVKGQLRGDVDVRHTVAIGEAKGFFVFQILGDAAQTATGHGAFAGVHQGDFPRLGRALVYFHFVCSHVKGDVGHVQKVVRKILFDDVAFVAAADDKVVDAVRRVGFHDVPQNGLATNLNHRFRTGCGLFADAGA